MRANDAVAGLTLIALAGAMIALSASFPAFPGQPYGPSLFPRVLGSGLILCGAILVWRGLAGLRLGERWFAVPDWARDPRRLTSLFLILASLVFYILAAETAGFLPVAAAILVVLFLWFGVRWFIALPLAAGATLAIHWFFSSAMRVPLPRGWLDAIL